MGKADLFDGCSTPMRLPWPFRKKETQKSRVSRKSYTRNIVQYERKSAKEEQEREDDHLKKKKFSDAMDILKGKE
ncbi:MAG: hypothetical protein CMB66_05810 [Euryarchaeota archaeon]|nr:hypothetical protein [Euryarchaeota archaeon]